MQPAQRTPLLSVTVEEYGKNKKRLLAREVGSFAGFLPLWFPGLCVRPVENWDLSELILPVSWSGPVVVAWNDGGRSARMNYKPGKSREKAKEWPLGAR